ncbi:DUF2971 domain-containing protein [Sphingomonas sp. HITSZ_GF]|uniref:DUF2971 domain-containing protein n=1 Tax=Sphingomonas sp. HITSZ_GF TaxID=3037247 RepID=UPI00240E1D81|nr:DUF2971 domain-containing protein [Sphingomonas sp. HITSZ_GF]MDG2532749.1 DUF2971 domain-containing protein [Sphingomonas sp. HITSZ_GF]
MTSKQPNVLKRFTPLVAAIDMLVNERLALLNPASWTDTNDVAFLSEYGRQRGATRLFAACFTQAPETYHHWQVFAGSNEGVCVEFDRGALLGALLDDDSYYWRDMEYVTIEKLRARRSLALEDLPFLKRWGYRDEQEFRLIHECRAESPPRIHHVPIKRAWITRIVLNPWLSEGLADGVKLALRSLPGCGKLKVARTTLIDNARWKAALGDVEDYAPILGPPPKAI